MILMLVQQELLNEIKSNKILDIIEQLFGTREYDESYRVKSSA
jgi:hypothetical protein